MALRWVEGFEVRQAATHFARLYASTSGTFPTISTGRKAGSAAIAGTAFSFSTPALVGSVTNTWIICFAVLKSGIVTMSSEDSGIDIRNSAGSQCRLHFIAGSTGGFKAELRRGATVIATSAETFLPGGARAWHYFALKVTVRPGTDGVYELQHWTRDNTNSTVFSGSGVNLANQGTDGADRVTFHLAPPAADVLRMDDIVVLDDSGTLNNIIPTLPYVVLGSLPNAAGGLAQWTAIPAGNNHQRVDDPATAVDDTDYVYADADGLVDLYGYSDLAAINSSTNVAGVMVATQAGMLASGSRDVAATVRSGVDDHTGTAQTVQGSSIRSLVQCFDQNPTGTPAAWTKASFDAIQIGVATVAP